MKKLICFWFIILSVNVYAQVEKIGPFTKVGNERVEWIGNSEKVCVEPFGIDAIRFRSSRSLHITNQDWNLIKPKTNSASIVVNKDEAVITNGNIKAILTSGGNITYYNNKGNKLLSNGKWERKFISKGSNLFSIEFSYNADADEKLYGMGQYANNFLNLKGLVLDLMQKNGQISIPFLLSTKGYGFIWNNPSLGRAEFALNMTRFSAKLAKQIDYVMIAESTIAKIERKYTNLTGKSPEMPYYATGFWQSKLRYATQDELMSVAREYKKRNLPISVIVADYYHWPISGDWKFNEKYWPNVKGMVNELNSMNINLLVSVWPTVAHNCSDYKNMRDHNYLINTEQGSNIVMETRDMLSVVDVTNPDARTYMWNKVRKNYYDKGVRMFWLDEAEPDVRPAYIKNLRYYLGNGLEMSNIYPYLYAKTFYEGQKSAGQKDIINLVRSGWIGSQRYATLLWSGDIRGTYTSLKNQIVAGQNISLCGIPWWNTDIGGFYSYPKEKSYPELLIRWFQYGCFCPVMRLHGDNKPSHSVEGQLCGSGLPNEVWSFGDKAYKIMSHYLKVREKLRPYIYKQMKNASKNGDPVMRPLFYDFPNDENAYNYKYQYMFGPDLLVTPVADPGITEMAVYLPKGAQWTDARTGKKYDGGKEIIVKVDLNNIPVFCKDSFKFNLND